MSPDRNQAPVWVYRIQEDNVLIIVSIIKKCMVPEIASVLNFHATRRPEAYEFYRIFLH